MKLVPLLAAFAFPLIAFAQASSDPAFAQAVEAFKKGDYTEARILFEMIADKNPRDQTAARNYLNLISAREKTGVGAPVNVTLKSIIIPKIDFDDVTVQDALAYLAQRVKQLSGGKQSLNIVWKLPEGVNPRVTFSLQQVPASEVLRYISETAGLQFVYDSLAVTVQPLPPK